MEEISGVPATETQSASGQQFPATSADATAASAEGEGMPEDKAAKTFTQEELDAIVEKRLAKEQRKAARERERLMADILSRQQPKQESPQQSPKGKPIPQQFATTEDYVEAVAEWKANEILKSQRQEMETRSNEEMAQRYRAELNSEYRERVEEASSRYDDYDEITSNPLLSITPAMADAIIASDVGPDVAYYLGVNPKEAGRISRLPPLVQIKEIGRLEARVIADPPAKKTSSAPNPLSPVKPKGSVKITDTLNPKSLETLGTSEWIRLENERMRKKLEAGRR